jgi:hypothetical protein
MQHIARGAGRGLSCQFKDLCAEFDSVGQLFLIRQRGPECKPSVSCAVAGRVMDTASNSVVNAALYGRLQ